MVVFGCCLCFGVWFGCADFGVVAIRFCLWSYVVLLTFVFSVLFAAWYLWVSIVVAFAVGVLRSFDCDLFWFIWCLFVCIAWLFAFIDWLFADAGFSPWFYCVVNISYACRLIGIYVLVGVVSAYLRVCTLSYLLYCWLLLLLTLAYSLLVDW